MRYVSNKETFAHNFNTKATTPRQTGSSLDEARVAKAEWALYLGPTLSSSFFSFFLIQFGLLSFESIFIYSIYRLFCNSFLVQPAGD